MRADYRARLCENLTAILGKIYARQTPKLLRDMLKNQQRVGHAVGESQTVKNLYKRYSNLMLQAIDHLPDDPMVQAWLKIRKKLGDWEYLRIPRKGFEKGVKKPYPTSRDALADLTILELGAKRISPGKIREELKTQNLPTFTREWIRQRLKINPFNQNPRRK